MHSAASSSQTSLNDPSPKAEVNIKERTACFRKPSSHTLEIQGNTYEVELLRPGALKRSNSSSEESTLSRVNSSSILSSAIDDIEYRRLSFSNDSSVENSPPRVTSTPSVPEIKRSPEKIRLSQYIETYLKFTSDLIYSWNVIPVYIMFIGLSSQAAYMGYKYSDDCPFLSGGVSMFLVMGCSGCGATLTQILTLIQKHRQSNASSTPSGTQVGSCLFSAFYIGTFSIELYSFLAVEGLPSITAQDVNYCHLCFYGYVCWSNIMFSMLTVMLFIIFAPHFFLSFFKGCCKT